MLRFASFGRVTLFKDGESLLPGRRKLLAVLVYLLRQRKSVSRDALGALFWPEADQARSRQSVRTALTELRAAVGSVIVAENDDVWVESTSIELDAIAFESDVDTGAFASAVERWHGAFLAGFEDIGDDTWRSWLEGERARLERQLSWALEQLYVQHEAAGEWDKAVRFAERLAETTPGDEAAAARVVTTLRRAGRENQARARHTELARQLESISGSKPSRSFARLASPAGGSGAAQAPGKRGLITPDLVGRDQALALLKEAWTEARSGNGRCVIVDGEEGLGKTRLLDEFTRRTRVDGTMVISERAFVADRDRQLSTLEPILTRLADAPGLAAVPPDVLAALAAVSRACRERFRVATVDSAMPLEQAVHRAITDIAYEAPVALCLDDASDADTQSLDVLMTLMRRPPSRFLLVMSGRAVDWPRIGDVRSSAHVSVITLQPLSREETRRFIGSTAPGMHEVADTIGDRLHAESGGRPAMLRLLLGELADRGVVTPDPTGRWHLTSRPGEVEVPIPGSVADRIRGVMASLATDSRRLLEAAAVIGPRVDPSVLEETSGVARDAYRVAVTDLLTRRLMRSGTASSTRLEFVTEAERRAVYEQVTPSTRRGLHRAAARSLGRLSPDPVVQAMLNEHRRLGGRPPWARVAVAAAAVIIGAAGLAAIVANPIPLPDGAQLVLASVQNTTGDTTLSSALHLAARIGLEQSRRFSLMSNQQVSDVLARMRQRVPREGPDESLAREIAVRENLPAFIHIAIAAFDSSYLVTGRIIEPSAARDLFSTKVTARDRSDILRSLDEVVKQLRMAVGDSRLVARRSAQSLPQITTASLEALRFYVAGRDQWSRSRLHQAKEHWVRAVELDSAFALALIGLGQFYYAIGDAGKDRAEGDRYLDRALSHADRISDRERQAMLAIVARLRGTPTEARQRVVAMAERYPGRDTWMNVGTMLLAQEDWRGAVAAYRRTLGYDSAFAVALGDLGSAYSMGVIHEQVPLADSAVAAYERAARTDSAMMLAGGFRSQQWAQALLLAHRAADAESLLRRVASVGSEQSRFVGKRSLAFLLMHQGRYREADAQLEESLRSSHGLAALTVARNRWIRAMGLLALGDASTARRELDAAEQTLGELATEPTFLLYLADLHLRTGNRVAAERLVRRVETLAKPTLPVDRGAASVGRALLALQDGRIDSAIAWARGAARIHHAYRDAILLEGYQRLNRRDSSLAAAKRLADTWQFGFEAQPFWTHAPLRLARLHLADGDSAQARAAVARQLVLWKRGDADLPDLVEARRLAELLRN